MMSTCRRSASARSSVVTIDPRSRAFDQPFASLVRPTNSTSTVGSRVPTPYHARYSSGACSISTQRLLSTAFKFPVLREKHTYLSSLPPTGQVVRNTYSTDYSSMPRYSVVAGGTDGNHCHRAGTSRPKRRPLTKRVRPRSLYGALPPARTTWSLARRTSLVALQSSPPSAASSPPMHPPVIGPPIERFLGFRNRSLGALVRRAVGCAVGDYRGQRRWTSQSRNSGNFPYSPSTSTSAGQRMAQRTAQQTAIVWMIGDGPNTGTWTMTLL